MFEVLAWTPSTKGTVTAPAIHLVAPQGPIVADPAGRRGADGRAAAAAARRSARTDRSRAQGVLREHGAEDEGRDRARRRADSRARSRRRRPPSAATTRRRRRSTTRIRTRRPAADAAADGGPRRRRRADAARTPADPTRLTRAAGHHDGQRVPADDGAAVRINDAGREHGQIRAFNGIGLRRRRKPCRQSSCATRTTAASRASLPTARRSRSSSTSSTARTRQARRPTTPSRRFPAPTRRTKS